MKMRIFAFVFLLTTLYAKAQQTIGKENMISDRALAPSVTRFEEGLIFYNVKDIIKWFVEHQQANVFFELRALDTSKDVVGNTHIRLRQYYKNIPVEGSMILVHCKGNAPYSFNGVFYPTLQVDLTQLIKPEITLQIAKETFIKNSVFSWQTSAKQMLEPYGFHESDNVYQVPIPQLSIVGIHEANNGIRFHLTHEFSICTVSPFDYKKVFVDAQNGSVLLRKSIVYQKDKKGIAYTKYSGVREIFCDSLASNKYTLIERDRGLDSIIVKNGKAVSPFWFYDDDNIWNNFNAQKDEVATDIHWGIGRTYDYYKSRFSRNSYDNKGHAVQGNAHAGSKSDGAYWVSNGIGIFGDGDDTMFDAWTSIDIVAHEFTHGVTENSSDLYYERESGALNESYSDIFGKCVEYFALKDSFSWQLAKQIMLNGHPSIRSFDDPNSRKHPKYYRGRFYNDTTNDDNYGVHTNSSVQNYWFYLLSEGGMGTREADSKPFTVHKIGIDTAEIIAYATLTNYLSPTSKFIDAAMYSIAATKLLFGDSSHLVQEVINAWYAVGVLNTTSISETKALTQKGWSIHPNPTKGTVYLTTVNKNIQETSFTLYDITGRPIPVIFSSQNQYEVTVDLSTLSAGLFFLELLNEDGEKQVLPILKE